MRWVRHLSWPWMAALGLLVFCAGIIFSVVVPAQHEIAALQQRLLSIQQQLHSTARVAASIRNASPDQLASFYRYFPAEQSMPDHLEKILDAAHENNLSLKQGEYRVISDQAGRLLRYQIILPVKGPYLHIRNFLAAVLLAVPTVSLDNVKFERQKIGDDAVDSTIWLTLYMVRKS